MIDTILWFVLVATPIVVSLYLRVSQMGFLWIFGVILYAIAVSRRMSKISAISLYITSALSVLFYVVTKYMNYYIPIDAYALFFIIPALLGLTVGTIDEKFVKHAFIIASMLQVHVLTDESLLYNNLKPVFAPLQIAFMISYVVLVLGVLFGKLFSRIV